MNADWLNYLAAHGASIDAGRVQHFGDPAAELAAAASGAILTDLAYLGLLELTGADAAAFLQGQMTNDVHLLDAGGSQFAGYCTAKGRLLATLLLWKDGDSCYAQLDGSIAASVMQRLKLYVLRSKVSVGDAGDKFIRFGIAGAAAEQTLAEMFATIPQQPHQAVRDVGALLLRLPGIAPRFELIAAPDSALNLWQSLSRQCRPAGAVCWEWLDIRAGIPQVCAATQEEFIPQTLNLDLLDSISFKKGCYVGQEIVARTHHLGTVKRRMQLAHIAADQPPQAGDDLFGAAGVEPAGKIVNAAAAPAGGYDVLAAVRLECLEAGPIRWGTPEGPVLELMPLPYATC